MQSTLLGLKFEHCRQRAGCLVEMEGPKITYTLYCAKCQKSLTLPGEFSPREAAVAIAALEGFEVYER